MYFIIGYNNHINIDRNDNVNIYYRQTEKAVITFTSNVDYTIGYVSVTHLSATHFTQQVQCVNTARLNQ